MACFGADEVKEEVDVCRECGGGVDSEGMSVNYCHYSPRDCEYCGSAPCIGAC